MHRYLKHILILFIIVTCSAVTTSAQDRVYPNRPVAMLKSNSGLIAMLEYHGGYGVANGGVPYSKSFNGVNVLVGYQLNKSFIIAAGTGVSAYHEGSLMPVFGDMRYTFFFKRIAPFLYGDAGLLMNFYDLSKTRIFLSPGIGARYSISRKIAINIATGIFVQSGASGEDVFVNLRTGVIYKY